MKVGGIICVKNEERLIARNLRYHLRHQGFDLIMVVNNGSYDRTVEEIRSLGDDRILLVEGERAGMAQDVESTRGALRLFNEFGCDWVVPIDADEFWFSRQGATLRQVLEASGDRHDLLVTDGYRYLETERDDPGIADPFRRLQYAERDNLPKLLMYRLGDDLDYLIVGNHKVKLKRDRKLRTAVLALETLARAHYRQLSVDDFRHRIMNQAEGWLLRYGEEWVRGNGNAERIRQWYGFIRDGRFEEKYRRLLVLEEAAVASRLAEGTLFRIGPPPLLAAQEERPARAEADR